MKKLLPLIILSLTSNYCIAQSPFVFDDTKTNHTNNEGNKHGIWVQYLDQMLLTCDKEKARFYGYELYDNGIGVFKFLNSRFKKKGRLKCTLEGDSTKTPMVLSGTFYWYDKKGRLLAEEQYRDGKPFHYKSFKVSRKKPYMEIFSQNLYYNILYNNQIGSFYYEEYKNGKLIRMGHYRIGYRGWEMYFV